jgi:hypothetical protein
MVPTAQTEVPTITVSNYLALSNAIGYELSFGGYTSYIYHGWIITSNMAGRSDESIISELITGTPIYKNDNKEGTIWGYTSLEENTSYTYVAIPVNSQGIPGPLYKRAITTKRSASQPGVTLTILSISGTSIYFTSVMNSYCSRYLLVSYSDNTSTRADVFNAYDVYKFNNWKTQNIYSGSGTYFPMNTSFAYTYVVALGYDGSGNNSGVVDVKVINNNTKQVVRSAVVNPSSTSSSARGDGSLLMIKNVEKTNIKELKSEPVQKKEITK